LSSLTWYLSLNTKQWDPDLYMYHINCMPLYAKVIINGLNSPHNGQRIEEVCNQMENERGWEEEEIKKIENKDLRVVRY